MAIKLKTIQAGKYRHVGSFYKNSLTATDETGERLIDPQLIGNFHFSIEPMTGNEVFQPTQAISECTHMIRLRYQPNILADAWLYWQGNNYDIKEALNLDGMTRELVLFAVLRL